MFLTGFCLQVLISSVFSVLGFRGMSLSPFDKVHLSYFPASAHLCTFLFFYLQRKEAWLNPQAVTCTDVRRGYCSWDGRVLCGLESELTRKFSVQLQGSTIECCEPWASRRLRLRESKSSWSPKASVRARECLKWLISQGYCEVSETIDMKMPSSL